MKNNQDTFDKRADTMDQFCYRHNVGKTFTYSEIANGRLQSIKIGRKRLIPREYGEAWFTSYYTRPSPEVKTNTNQNKSHGKASRAA